MRAPFLFFLATTVATVSCGRPSSPIPDQAESLDQEVTSSSQTSAIPITGGRAVSADGLFAVVVAPLTFEQLVTIEIERLEEAAADDEQGVMGLYRVRFGEDHVDLNGLPSTHSVRVEFTMAQEQADQIGIEDMRVTYRTSESGEADGQLEPRYLDGKVWATSNRLIADFGLLRTDTTNNCACDSDDSCTEACPCDPDCPPTDAGPDNSGGDTGSTNSDSTVSCEVWEFTCADESQCIPEIYLCDGSAQCEDGSDESPATCQGSNGGNPVGGDQYEPDNDFSEASEIEAGETQTRSLTSGDGDFIRFVLSETQDVVVTVSPQSMNMSTPIIQVYREDFSQIVSSESGAFTDLFGDSAEVTVNPLLEAGTYFIYVSSVAEPVGAYTLNVVARAPLVPGPTNLTIAQEGTSVVLNWDSLEGFDSYNVYYGEYAGGPYESSFLVATEGSSPLTTTATTQNLSGLPDYVEVFAVVRGVDVDGVETYASNEVSIFVTLAPDSFEPDDTQEQASLFSADPLGTGTYTQVHSAHEVTDVDWISFELLGPSDVTARISSTTYADAELFLYNDAGTELGYGYLNDFNGEETLSSVSASDLPAGSYYLMTRPYDGWSTYNNYTLNLDIALSGPISGPADAFESDDSLESIIDSEIHLLRPGVPQTHSIHEAGDIDFVRFELTAESNIVLQTQAISGDTVMKLYNTAGEIMQSDETEGALSRIERTDMPAGTYFVSVGSQSTPEYIESYTLSLDAFAKPEAPTDVSVTPISGGLAVLWTAVPDATGYRVYYQYSNNPPFQVFEANEGPSPLSVSVTSTILSGLPTDAATFICVAAIHGSAEGECSETVSGTPHGS